MLASHPLQKARWMGHPVAATSVPPRRFQQKAPVHKCEDRNTVATNHARFPQIPAITDITIAKSSVKIAPHTPPGNRTFHLRGAKMNAQRSTGPITLITPKTVAAVERLFVIIHSPPSMKSLCGFTTGRGAGAHLLICFSPYHPNRVVPHPCGSFTTRHFADASSPVRRLRISLPAEVPRAASQVLQNRRDLGHLPREESPPSKSC
jgi:hypothetical protein